MLKSEGTRLSSNPLPAFCPSCGHDLASLPPREGWVFGKMDLRKAARHQRRLLWLILASIVLQLAMMFFDPLTATLGRTSLCALAVLVLSVAAIVCVTNMLAALGTDILVRVLLIVLLFAPCINLVVLLIANRIAIRMLRGAGLRVGLMGVRDEQVVRHLGTYRCRQCGYNLIGNVSGRCPECGTPTSINAPPTTPA